MKFMLLFIFIACWLVLAVSDFGIYVYNKQVSYQDGSRHLRCYYLKATTIATHDIALAGRLGVVCPQKF